MHYFSLTKGKRRNTFREIARSCGHEIYCKSSIVGQMITRCFKVLGMLLMSAELIKSVLPDYPVYSKTYD